MLLKKSQWPILIIGIIMIIVFTIIFSAKKNYEFLGYVGVLVFFFLLILFTNKKVQFPNYVLWSLLIWAIMHMSGGGLMVNGKRLYGFMILNIVGDPYNIFRYDQLVHLVGFGVGTLAMFYLLKPKLKLQNKWVSISIVVIMAGLGVGALNEIIEFFTTVIVPETGVGGYINTSLDLVFDLIGAILAMIFIYFKEKKTYLR